MIKAVIFDMDGTMVNTQKLWGEVNRRLTALYGFAFDESLRKQMMGRKDVESLTILRDYYKLPVDVNSLVLERRRLLLEDLSSVKVNKGLYELLHLLEILQIKKAVATSAYKEYAYKVLSLFDLKERYEIIITGDDVQFSKPDPTIFLEAAKSLQVSPERCLVLEDAENGVEAAYRAHMKVFAIPHDISTHHDFSHATRILTSLEEISYSLLSEL